MMSFRKTLKYLSFFALFVFCCTFQIADASSKYVKLGDKGQKVEEVQAMLAELNFYKASIDGHFGAKTKEAVQKFQKSVKRAQNGDVDTTLHKLLIKKSGLDFKKLKKPLLMEATAYSAYDPGCSGKTATGAKLQKGIIAVDPRVIPLGTKVYVVGYGTAKALDTGGAIKGNIIDVAFNSHREALNWGRRTVKVYMM